MCIRDSLNAADGCIIARCAVQNPLDLLPGQLRRVHLLRRKLRQALCGMVPMATPCAANASATTGPTAATWVEASARRTESSGASPKSRSTCALLVKAMASMLSLIHI